MSDDRFDRIENKIDKISEHISRIDVTLVAQHESLKTHIKRTDALEEIVIPISNHDKMILGVVKAVGLITAIGAGIGGFLEGAIMLLKYLHIKG